MRTTAIIILGLGWALPVQAGEAKFDAEKTAKSLAPFIDEHTFLVARFDPRQGDLAGWWSLVEPIFPMDPEDKESRRKTLKEWQSTYVKLGGRDIYVVYGASDFPRPPCLLTPIGESPPERKDLFDMLKMVGGDAETTWENLHGFLCVGSRTALNRLKDRKQSNRDDILQALKGMGEAPMQVVFAPGADARKVFEEIAPTLPSEIGGGSIQILTRGLKWAGLSVGPLPKAVTKFVVQAADEESARMLQNAFVKGIATTRGLFRSGDPNERAAFLKFHERFTQLLTPKVDKDRLVVELDLGTVAPELARLIKDFQPAARSVSMNNLKHIGLAIHNHAATYGDRLPGNILDKEGKPLLSWRVAILPYIEQQELYRQFKLDQPWDSEHNKKLIAQMPKIYRSPKQSPELKDRTTYLAPLGNGLMWDDPKGQRFATITDGLSHTIMIVETDDDRAVVWTKPDDIVIDMKEPAKGLLGHYVDGFIVLMGDGSVRTVSKDYSAIWALFTRAGGEVTPQK
jgi:Protein of unknown function (DUF1559)